MPVSAFKFSNIAGLLTLLRRLVSIFYTLIGIFHILNCVTESESMLLQLARLDSLWPTPVRFSSLLSIDHFLLTDARIE
jgi:hypothetical protein